MRRPRGKRRPCGKPGRQHSRCFSHWPEFISYPLYFPIMKKWIAEHEQVISISWLATRWIALSFFLNPVSVFDLHQIARQIQKRISDLELREADHKNPLKFRKNWKRDLSSRRLEETEGLLATSHLVEFRRRYAWTVLRWEMVDQTDLGSGNSRRHSFLTTL